MIQELLLSPAVCVEPQSHGHCERDYLTAQQYQQIAEHIYFTYSELELTVHVNPGMSTHREKSGPTIMLNMRA